MSNQRRSLRQRFYTPVGTLPTPATGGSIFKEKGSQFSKRFYTCEGRGTKLYFQVLRSYLRAGWDFPRRQRRPPPDPVNALLSLAYTFLHQCVFSAIEVVGLDPYCGFYHSLKYGRPALALDLMEEFRPLVADSVVLTLVNKRILSPEDFAAEVGDGVRLEPAAMRKFIHQFTHRLQTQVTHPPTGRKTTYLKLFEIQARQVAGVLLGKSRAYAPFTTR